MTKIKIKPIALLAAGLLWVGLANAQETVNAAGGDATGSSGTIAYSIGQIAYTTNTGATGSVAQGVQQPFDITLVGIMETALHISLSIFPNPTADNLTLQIDDYDNEKLGYQLTDMQGKLLNSQQVMAPQTIINTPGLSAATYFIHVVNQQNKNIQSFKIIKN